MYTVYLRTNTITGMQYVGITSMTVEERAGKNGSRYQNCPYLYNAILKYGWDNFESVVLASDLTHQQACDLERHYIQLYDTIAPHGYNLTSGGDGGFTHTDETKHIISLKTKGNKSRTGYHNSDEHKQKMSQLMSQLMRGNTYGRLTGQPVEQYTMDGVFVAEYASAAEATRQTGITGVKHAAAGRIKSAGGYLWKKRGK